MDIPAGAENFGQRLIAAQQCRYAQLYLAVIKSDQHQSFVGDKRVADDSAELGFNRNVLEIRVLLGDAAGRGPRLQVRGVQSAVVVEQCGNSVNIG